MLEGGMTWVTQIRKEGCTRCHSAVANQTRRSSRALRLFITSPGLRGVAYEDDDD